MRPFIISITGAHSGCGKTSVAEAVLGGINARCGAVKYTGTALYSSISDDDAVISQEGKDTARMKGSGAEYVLWIRSPRGELPELLEMAMERFAGLDVIVVEGNGPAELLRPDILIFVFGDDISRVKESAKPLIGKADYVLYKEMPSIKTPAKMYNKCSDIEISEMLKDVNGRISGSRRIE
ncbi:hypothetical protein BMS3Abin07_01975 [bacterium BMS3Abin07]|nr:hypothetical protein BMS3Abin07_01975 [bacterium BMS3Abin07]GBE32420.1 hypothetical protein BMS3Bbin05_01335 [bacterium BMS3Bbin05]HDL20835.1 hypothetical protein [Nitrospirota bacterium]HDO23359.1 hypothetical protein [Nitrospirota bacterium]HDZ89004.1 hypothetical protein [Nitrospirota bacterium]